MPQSPPAQWVEAYFENEEGAGMTRKELNAFKPETLRVGQSKHFEVRNPLTGYKQVHYFYRDADGELFTAVCQNVNAARLERNEWLKKKSKKTVTAEDPLIEEAKKLARAAGFLSVSHLQRNMRIGYTRAASLIDKLEAEGFCVKEPSPSIRYAIAAEHIKDEVLA